MRLRATVVAMAVLSVSPAVSQDTDDLAKKLANPVANMVSVPIQSNFDFGAGANGHGFAYTANIQPVIPISLNDDWLILSRTVIPIGYRDYSPGGDVFGLGDINASLFLSPKAPNPNGIIWGIGPVFLLPTATDDFLGTGKFGLGPTGVLAKQTGPWTIGVLGNHIWSVAGDHDRADISQTFVQPFVSYGLGHGRTLSLNTEASYDWKSDQWTVPINLGISQVFKLGDQAMSIQVGAKYYAEAPQGAPQWGIRTTLTFLFPEK
ncbi:transporter [Mesorhizobium sp.]|uniref:transporter n=1 Tax=Mesorhizobium sp. TaxID=1871066 RepID=UPI0025BDD556|nr:transporter [Mesorhizobium sp.]